MAKVPAGQDAVYRGWMVGADRYAGFVAALAERGVVPRTGAEAHRRAHELPGWYAALAPVTPRSVWTVGDGRDAFDRARAELGGGPAVLRDYRKSAKHHWDEAAYVPDLADGEHAWRMASRLRELRGDDFARGFVLREYEPFTGAEARTW
ncbi:ATP-grasp domain-containing protein [Actinophytocola gossypii]|uniref:ATP-grasp domain-containing protein n=1 Tax=Actinophytocola gossypii TaxID=2812003 RepID=UPI0021A3BFF4|nr:ATP-grasp domain-containing protein [Actinophytocola gossypii]